MSLYFRFCRIYLLVLPLCLLFGCSTNLNRVEAQLEVSQPTVKPMVEPTVKPTTQSTPESENLGQILPITAKAIVGGETIELEVARTPEEQELGLMYRKDLADNRGMLFTLAQPSIARFWMKNCLISLDMVFLRGDRIVSISENVPPCQKEPCPTYSSEGFVDRVIELRAGRAKELNLKRGDRISVEFLDNPLSENQGE